MPNTGDPHYIGVPHRVTDPYAPRQITMMECGLWDFSHDSPTPLEVLDDTAVAGGAEDAAGGAHRSNCGEYL